MPASEVYELYFAVVYTALAVFDSTQNSPNLPNV